MNIAQYAYQVLFHARQNGANNTAVSQALAVLGRLSVTGGNPTPVESNELISAIGGVKTIPTAASIARAEPVASKVAPPVEKTWDQSAAEAAAKAPAVAKPAPPVPPAPVVAKPTPVPPKTV
jgi:hypothetical protein